MSLASEIEWIEYHAREVNPEVTEQFLRALINSYRKKKTHNDEIIGELLHPMLDKVIKGETTYKEQLEYLGPADFFLKEPGNFDIFGGTFDLNVHVSNLDSKIRQLYPI